MKYIIVCLFAICCVNIYAQDTHKTYIIKDSITSFPISDCYIKFYFNNNVEHSTISNYKGMFQIEEGTTKISLSHIGYTPKSINLQNLDGNIIYLVPKHFQIEETTVLSQAPSYEGNLFKYNTSQAASSISIIGEPDILRHISSFPGTSSGIEGSLGLFVRGGNCSSNGIYFNNVPMYVTSHLMGLFSVFPPEMIDNATFHLGGLPASKGNSSSSLLDITPQKDYGKPFNGKFYISPYLSGIYSSIPLVKNKISLQISGRTTFLPYILNWLNNTGDEMKIDIYDTAVKFDYKVSNKHTLDGMLFLTNDYFEFTQGHKNCNIQNWKSLIGKFGWNFQLNNRLNIDFTSYYTYVHSLQKSIYYTDNDNSIESKIGISFSLKEWSAKTQFNYIVNNGLRLNGGLSIQKQLFSPGNEKYIIDQSNITSIEKHPNTIGATFCEVMYDISDIMDFRMGYRHSLQKAGETLLSDFDVHLLNRWYLNQKFGLELTYDRQNQFFHVLEGLPTGWSMNMMVPCSMRFPSELINQYYVGLFIKKTIESISLNLLIGGYYRKMKNLLTYINAINAFGFTTDSWEEEVDLGKGKSYGLEFSSSLKSKHFNSSLSYTLSKSDRTFPLINNAITFPFKFDRRHILNFQGQYVFSKSMKSTGSTKHSIGYAITYTSGNRITLPIGTYQGMKPPYWDHLKSGHIYPSEFYFHIYDRQQMSEKNSISTKDYFRTDIAYNLTKQKKKYIQEFSFSVYNLFNRHNPYTLFQENGNWKQLSIIPIMPSFRWSISW